MEVRFGGYPVLDEIFSDGLFGKFFDGSNARTSQPAVDVNESNEAFEVIAEVPGVAKDDLTVSVEQNILNISGKRTLPPADGKRRIVVELSHSDVSRKFRLPASADVDAITTEYANGILKITIPKKAQSKVKNIPIN